MNGSEETPRNPHGDVPGSEINLLDYLLVIARNLKMIVGVCAATFILTCVVTLLLPNIYTATSRILPPPQEVGGLTSMLGGMGGIVSTLAGVELGSPSADLYVGMLKSRSVADAVIDRLHLMDVYECKKRAAAYEALERNTRIVVGKKDGIVSVSVDDKDPARAAAIANAYVDELKRLNVMLSSTSVGRERTFLSERLAVARQELGQAEERLRDFQSTHKAIRLDEQATAVIEAIARLRAELASKEVQLGVLLTYQTERNPEVKAVREGIAQLKAQLRRLEQSPGGSQISGDVFPATSEVADLGIQYARLMRDFKAQESLFALLTSQHEMAKVNEAKQTAAIQVLDQAVAPDRKSRPRRSLIVLGVTFAAAVAALLGAFVLESLARMPEDDRRRWTELKRSISLRK